MEERSLRSLLRKVRKELSWPVVERSHQMPVLRIVSSPRDRSHLILKPGQAGKQHGDTEYLHELGHATLCERVHPVFSGCSRFAPMDNRRQFLVLVPALNVACDWFIGEWQMTVAPELTRQQIVDSLPDAQEILKQATLPPLEITLDAALVLARAIRYLDEPTECGGGPQTAVEAFLAVAAEKPSAQACVWLVNRLMATYSHQRAGLTQMEGHFVWEVLSSGAYNEAGVLPAGAQAGAA